MNNLVVNDSTIGRQIERFNGLDFVLNARLPRGSFVGGGLSVGGTRYDNCFANGRPDLTPAATYLGPGAVVANNPTDLCDVRQPFWHPQIKISGAYQLPWQLQASALWQNLPGLPIAASYVATNAQVQPSLGRPLSGGATSVTIGNIIRPFSQFEARINQMDVRLTRNFTVARARLQAQFDIYNLLNGNAVLAENTRYGSAWLTPTTILDPRLFKFGVQLNF